MGAAEPILQTLRPIWEADSTVENHSTIEFNGTINDFSSSELEDIFALLDRQGDLFRGFNVEIRESDGGMGGSIISGSFQRTAYDYSDLIQEHGSNVRDFRNDASASIRDNNYAGFVDVIGDWHNHHSFTVSISCIIDKNSVCSLLRDDLELLEGIHLTGWSSIEAIERWLDMNQEEIENVIHSLFPPGELPILLLFDGDFSNRSGVQVISPSDMDYLSSPELEEAVRDFQSRFGSESDVLEAGPDVPVLSPRLFSESDIRSIFSGIFLYSTFLVIAERTMRTDEGFQFSITTDKGATTEEITSAELVEYSESVDDDPLSALYQFYEEFIEQGTRKAYRKLWYRSISEECEDFMEIVQNIDNIRKIYYFLENEAIEANFDDLSDAIQDAHSFTIDITQNITNRTTALTSEIQKVIFALFAAVLANLFLVIRWAEIEMVLPFSIVAILVIVGLYYPTIQNRLDALEELISEGDEDFKLYAETIGEFSRELFDFSKFENRRTAYKEYARDQSNLTIRRLSIIYTMLLLFWGGFLSGSMIFFPIRSGQFIVALSSIVPAVLIHHYHSDYDYFPTGIPPVYEKRFQTIWIIHASFVISIGVKGLQFLS